MPADRRRYQIIVQSGRPPAYLEEKIEDFLRMLGEEIEFMSDGGFETHVSSLMHDLNQTRDTLPKRAAHLWKHIDRGDYDFAGGEPIPHGRLIMLEDAEMQTLRSISREDLLVFYYKYIHPSSPDRRVLSVHVKSQIPEETVHAPQRSVDGETVFLENRGYIIYPNEHTEPEESDGNLPFKNRGHGMIGCLAKFFELDKAIKGVKYWIGHCQSPILKQIGLTVDGIQSFQRRLVSSAKVTPVRPLATFLGS